MGYHRPSIRFDNRLLAVGSNQGIVLWDLAKGTECGFLPIGSHWQVMFEADGNFLTSGPTGVQRWPVRLDPDRNDFRIGPPHDLLFWWWGGQIAEDRIGRIIALSHKIDAEVNISGRPSRTPGLLDDCRYVAVSPEGEWLATGCHGAGVQIWRVRDTTTQVAQLPVMMGWYINFSPDGRWLLTGDSPCKLWTTGTWALARELGGTGLCFSPDSRLVAALDANQMIRLVEAETGRVIARLESPEALDVNWAAFSPDGSRLVLVSEKDAVRVWDLRAIRKRLAAIGLDWDAPAYSEDDPASSSSIPLPPCQLEIGWLAGEIERVAAPAPTMLQRYATRLENNPNDAEAYHQRGHAFYELGRVQEAIDDLNAAVRLGLDNGHIRNFLAKYRVIGARELVTRPCSAREAKRAIELARRALELNPEAISAVNSLGIALYRACQYREAIAALERHLAVSPVWGDGLDLYFLAMAHHRQGRRDQARDCFDRAPARVESHKSALSRWSLDFDLNAIAAEAKAVLARPAGELPTAVFTPAR